MGYTETYIYTGQVLSTLYHGGFHFTNVQVPQGRLIVSATLSVWIGAFQGCHGAQPVLVRCDDVDDSDDFSVSLPSARVLTTASNEWILSWAWGATWYTASAKDAVQEVINRAGWAPGNALSVIAQASNTASANRARATITSYDNNPAHAAKLEIAWG